MSANLYQVLDAQEGDSYRQLQLHYVLKRDYFEREIASGHPEARARLASLTEVYKMLSNRVARRDYDRSLKARQVAADPMRRSSEDPVASTWKFTAAVFVMVAGMFVGVGSHLDGVARDGASALMRWQPGNAMTQAPGLKSAGGRPQQADRRNSETSQTNFRAP